MRTFCVFIVAAYFLPVHLGASELSFSPSEFIQYKNWTASYASNIRAPSFLTSTKDPDTAHTVWRLGGSATEMGNKVPHPNGNQRITLTHAQHFYSRTNPTNSNETYALGSAGRGTSYAALWRLSDKQFVAWIPSAHPQSSSQQRQLLWDKNQHNVYWYTDGNRLIRVELNLKTHTVFQSHVWDQFSNYQSISLGLGEGDFSDDGERLVIIAKHKNKSKNKNKNKLEDYTLISYLVKTKTRLATKTIHEVGGRPLNWAGVDPTGQYIVFDFPAQGKGTWVLPFNLTGKPRRLYKHMKHSDFVVDKQGQSWIVFGNWQGVFATQLSSPLLKRVWPSLVNIPQPENYDGSTRISDISESASGHISRISALTGHVLLSRNEDGGLYVINISDPGRIAYVGNTRHGKRPKSDPLTKEAWGVDSHGAVVNSKGKKDYYREPRGSASASGRYIFFVSDYHVHGKSYASKHEFKAYLNMIETKP